MKTQSETSPDENRQELRKFGYVMGGFIGLFFGVIFPWLWSAAWPYWPWIIAAVFFSLAIGHPDSLNVPYKLWMRFSEILGWINTRIILGVVFIFVFSPMGLLMRTLGRDTLNKKWNSQLKTYRKESPSRKSDHMERQF